MRDSEASGGGRHGIDAALGLPREHAVTAGDVVAVVVVAALGLRASSAPGRPGTS
jgi:hypothetical protein